MTASDLRSKLSRAKGLGPAHHGVSHWWVQRVTAVALVPLSLWFLAGLLSAMLSSDASALAAWLSSPLNALLLALLLIAMFWHAKLGLQVVIEDYVHAPARKYTLLLANNFLCFLFAAAGLMAIIKLHL